MIRGGDLGTELLRLLCEEWMRGGQAEVGRPVREPWLSPRRRECGIRVVR